MQDFNNLELGNGFDGKVAFQTEIPPRNEDARAQMSGDVFSKMVYENICPGESVHRCEQCFVAHARNRLPEALPAASHVQPWPSGEFLGVNKEVAMEPLVGHLRHPYGLKGCVPDSEQVCLAAQSTLHVCLILQSVQVAQADMTVSFIYQPKTHHKALFCSQISSM